MFGYSSHVMQAIQRPSVFSCNYMSAGRGKESQSGVHIADLQLGQLPLSPYSSLSSPVRGGLQRIHMRVERDESSCAMIGLW